MTRIEDLQFTTNGWDKGVFSCSIETSDEDLIKFLTDNYGSREFLVYRGGRNRNYNPFSFLCSPASIPEIKNVIFNDPATIVLWADGTKTVVKTDERYGDTFNPEIGLAMAICKKAMRNKGNFNEVFKKWIWNKEK